MNSDSTYPQSYWEPSVKEMASNRWEYPAKKVKKTETVVDETKQKGKKKSKAKNKKSKKKDSSSE